MSPKKYRSLTKKIDDTKQESKQKPEKKSWHRSIFIQPVTKCRKFYLRLILFDSLAAFISLFCIWEQCCYGCFCYMALLLVLPQFKMHNASFFPILNSIVKVYLRRAYCWSNNELNEIRWIHTWWLFFPWTSGIVLLLWFNRCLVNSWFSKEISPFSQFFMHRDNFGIKWNSQKNIAFCR